MSHPAFVRTSFPLAAVSLLRILLPGAIVAGTLFASSSLQGFEFSPLLSALAVLSGALSLLFMQPPKNGTPLYMSRAASIGLQLLLRWLGILSLLLAVSYVGGVSNDFPRRVMLPWAVLAPGFVFIGTVALLALMRRFARSQQHQRTAVIAGYTEAGRSLAEKLKFCPELSLRFLGFFDDRGEHRLGSLNGFAQLGGLSAMAGYIRENSVDVIFVALPIRHVGRVMDLLDDVRDSTASIYYVPDVFVFDLIQARTGEIMGMPVVAMCETPFHGYRGLLKRFMDVVLTLGILVIALPLMLLIAALVKLSSPGPAIFRQRRYGLDGKEICVYKFRSMYVTEDGPRIPQARHGDPRVTPIGRVLRRYSLDELPQLFNVLAGTMSLVGPRPHAVAHNELYRRLIKGYMVRHKVLPGITGLAQVKGHRGETAEVEQMKSRVDCDLDYLRKWSPLLDLKILMLTAMRLFMDRKAY